MQKHLRIGGCPFLIGNGTVLKGSYAHRYKTLFGGCKLRGVIVLHLIFMSPIIAEDE